MKSFFISCGLVLVASSAFAQLPNGSIAPDFTATDINGIEHNLYSYLDSGYAVILDFSAAWCGPCWDYHEEGVLKTLHEVFGPDSLNQIRVLFLESEDSNSLDQLNGVNAGNTYATATEGDWVTGTPYPIIDNAGTIAEEYSVPGFPTILTVCPNRILTVSGQASVQAHADIFQQSACQYTSLSNDVYLLGYAGQLSTCGENPAALAVRMMNNGLDTLTAATVEVSKLLPFNATEVIGTVDWQGELGTYDFTTVSLMDVVIDGSTTYVFDVVTEDDNMANNSTSGYVRASEEVTNNLKITLKTDGAPEELGWELLSEDGNEVASALPGTENLEDTTEYSWHVTLPTLGCYRLNLIDAGGDGLLNLATSMDEVGFLEVNSMDGEVVVDQDLFYQELDAFSEVAFDLNAVEITSVDVLQAQMQATLYPNPSSSTVFLDLNLAQRSRVQVVMRNVAGQIVMTSDLGIMSSGNHQHVLGVENMASGTYMVEVQTGQHRQSLILLRQ